MKSEYRSLVEAIICDELKLAEISKIHAEAQEAATKAAETLSVVEKRLEARRVELSRLDSLLQNCHRASGNGRSGPEAHDRFDCLEREISEIRKSVKLLADWYLSGSPIRPEPPLGVDA